MTVEAGKTYRIRMINAGSLVFFTVCFAGHNVTIIAADSFPVTPLSVSCVDINLGQRYFSPPPTARTKDSRSASACKQF